MNIEQAKIQADLGTAQKFSKVTDIKSIFHGDTCTIKSVKKGWVLIDGVKDIDGMSTRVNVRASQITIKI